MSDTGTKVRKNPRKRRTFAERKSYEYQRAQLMEAGQWQPFTDAQPAREHLQRIQAATGLSCRALDNLIGLTPNFVWNALNEPRPKMRVATSEKILAFWPDLEDIAQTLPDEAHVDATGTRRRLQALAWLGHTFPRMAAEVGMWKQDLRKAAVRDRVRLKTALAVLRLYREWSTLAPPETTLSEQVSAARIRRRADAARWAPPAAWDSDTIDDPTAKPDWSAVRCTIDRCDRRAQRYARLCHKCKVRLRDGGSESARVDGENVAEDARWIIRHEDPRHRDGRLNLTLIAERLGVSVGFLSTSLSNHPDTTEQATA